MFQMIVEPESSLSALQMVVLQTFALPMVNSEENHDTGLSCHIHLARSVAARRLTTAENHARRIAILQLLRL